MIPCSDNSFDPQVGIGLTRCHADLKIQCLENYRPSVPTVRLALRPQEALRPKELFSEAEHCGSRGCLLEQEGQTPL